MTNIIYVNRGISGGVSPYMKSYCQKKLDFDNVDEIKLFFSSENDGFVINAKFEDKSNHHYYLTSKDREFHYAVDSLKDLCNSSISKHKNKLDDRQSWVKERVVNNDEEDGPHKIVKEKRIIASRMSEDEAIDEMLELGHNFFVFRNDNDDVAIVYRRYDGNCGLIEVK